MDQEPPKSKQIGKLGTPGVGAGNAGADAVSARAAPAPSPSIQVIDLTKGRD